MSDHDPPITEQIRLRAKQSPGSWLYSVDPDYDPDGEVPGYAIAGAWPVDEAGNPGAFVANPDYRPSPAAMGLNHPTGTVDAALQRAATGHGAVEEVLAELAANVVYLPVDANGQIVAYEFDAGTRVVLFTDPDKAFASVPQLLPIHCRDLLPQLPDGTMLSFNPGSQVALEVSSTELLDALADDNGSGARTVDGVQ